MSVEHSHISNADDKFTVEELSPYYSILFGVIGGAVSIIFSACGAAYGTAKSMEGIVELGIKKPALIMRSIVPVVMAGILGINGLAVSVIIIGRLTSAGNYSLYEGLKCMGAGIIVGFCNFASGIAIGQLGDGGSRAMAYKPVVFTAFVAMQGFAMVIGLYGLIVAVILSTQ
uniref:V-type proton ATPase proteolipid subunit n=1 Tax=Romanomermis culicivorax TaxID=13658 RepID=A0A915HJF7_ROMCU